MDRATASAACLVLLGGLAVGCSEPGEPVRSEIEQWMDAQVGGDADFGAVAAPVRPADQPAGRGEGDLMPFDTVEGAVTGVELACYGDDTLTFFVDVMRADGARYSTTGVEIDVACRDGARIEDLDTQDAESVRIGVAGADHEGAWSAVFLGASTSTR